MPDRAAEQATPGREPGLAGSDGVLHRGTPGRRVLAFSGHLLRRRASPKASPRRGRPTRHFHSGGGEQRGPIWRGWWRFIGRAATGDQHCSPPGSRPRLSSRISPAQSDFRPPCASPPIPNAVKSLRCSVHSARSSARVTISLRRVDVDMRRFGGRVGPPRDSMVTRIAPVPSRDDAAHHRDQPTGKVAAGFDVGKVLRPGRVAAPHSSAARHRGRRHLGCRRRDRQRPRRRAAGRPCRSSSTQDRRRRAGGDGPRRRRVRSANSARRGSRRAGFGRIPRTAVRRCR